MHRPRLAWCSVSYDIHIALYSTYLLDALSFSAHGSASEFFFSGRFSFGGASQTDRQTDRQTDQRPTPTGRRRTDRLGRDTPPSPTNHTLTTPHRHHRRHKREPTRTQTAGPHSTHATRQALHILVQARARIHSPITRQRHGHTPGPTLGHAHHHPPPPAQQQATHRLTRVHGNLQSR